MSASQREAGPSAGPMAQPLSARTGHWRYILDTDPQRLILPNDEDACQDDGTHHRRND